MTMFPRNKFQKSEATSKNAPDLPKQKVWKHGWKLDVRIFTVVHQYFFHKQFNMHGATSKKTHQISSKHRVLWLEIGCWNLCRDKHMQ